MFQERVEMKGTSRHPTAIMFGLRSIPAEERRGRHHYHS
jgi:hypothetical protein